MGSQAFGQRSANGILNASPSETESDSDRIRIRMQERKKQGSRRTLLGPPWDCAHRRLDREDKGPGAPLCQCGRESAHRCKRNQLSEFSTVWTVGRLDSEAAGLLSGQSHDGRSAAMLRPPSIRRRKSPSVQPRVRVPDFMGTLAFVR